MGNLFGCAGEPQSHSCWQSGLWQAGSCGIQIPHVPVRQLGLLPRSAAWVTTVPAGGIRQCVLFDPRLGLLRLRRTYCIERLVVATVRSRATLAQLPAARVQLADEGRVKMPALPRDFVHAGRRDPSLRHMFPAGHTRSLRYVQGSFRGWLRVV